MPLPPALAARLAKRGLIQRGEIEEKTETEEEVFVEHYDSHAEKRSESTRENEHDNEKDDTDPDANSQLIHDCIDCPNKENKYHECVEEYCKRRYGLKPFQPDSTMCEKKMKVLKKYPLPVHWLEVGDPGTNRYYYWNTNTDEVSWLPPNHPKAKIGLPAEKLKDLDRSDGSESESSSDSSSSEGESDSESDKSDDSDREDHAPMEEDFESRKLELQRRRGGGDDLVERRQGRKRRARDELDPMDPASYSEAPRGTWSSGLEKPGAAKTGVDATAAGPLFQQRPYPSPGAVLRMNQSKD